MQIANATVYTGDASFLEAAEYAVPTTNSLEVMARMVRGSAEQLKNIYNVSVEAACDQITNFRESSIGRRLLGAKHAIDNVSSSINIRTFKTCEELFGAPPTQFRYLSVAPGIQRHVKKELVAGYKGRFFNPYENIPLEENPDFQRVYSTMGVEKDDDIVFVSYANNYDQDDTELSFEQKASMIDNHKFMKLLLDNDIDCTSPYGDKL